MAKEDNFISICLPGENGWELWKQGASGTHMAQSVSLEDSATPASFKQANVLAYPVLASFVVPTWAQTGDEEMVEGVVNIQLEKQGLMPDSTLGNLLQTRIVEREPAQTLAVSAVLYEQVVPQLPSDRPQSYELSPYLYYLPEDSVVIWKELGKIVFCVTRREHPVYFHALTSSSLDSRAVSEIESLMMPLYMQGIVAELEKAVVWTDDTDPEALKELANALRLTVRREPRPAPAFSNSGGSSYEPTAVAAAKIREARMRKIKNIVTGVAAVYALAVVGLVGMYLWKQKQNGELKIQANALRSQVAYVQPVIDQWNLTTPLRDKDGFVMETARMVMESVSSRVFPVKITSLRISSEKEGLDLEKSIEIKGEAPQQNIATQYRNALVNNKDTSKYEWSRVDFPPQQRNVHPFIFRGIIKPPAEPN
jgi:hypothetical protein